MPFIVMSKLAKDASFMKFTFEYIRNFGLCAGLFVVGRWMDHGGGDANKDFVDSVLKWLFYVVGFCLTVINFEYGLHQIELMRLPSWWRAVAILVVLQCGGFTIMYLGSPNKSEALLDTTRGHVAESPVCKPTPRGITI